MSFDSRRWIREHLLAADIVPAYWTAAIVVGIASLINLGYQPRFLQSDGHYFTLVAAVFLAALHGGLGPGILATLLAVLSSAYFSLPPLFSLQIASPDELRRLIVFGIEGVLISIVSHVMRYEYGNRGILHGRERHFVAVLPVLAATVLKALLLPQVAFTFPFALNYSAVCISAWLGGLAWGVAATILAAALTRYFFLPPVHSLSLANELDSIRLGVFVCEGLVLSLLNGKHFDLSRLARFWSSRAARYLTTARDSAMEAHALRTVSRDTIWEWVLGTGKIARTPSWRDAISNSLPERETFEEWTSRMHPENRDATLSMLWTSIHENQEECRYFYRLLASDGDYVTISDHAFVIRDPEGNAVRVIGRSAEFDSAQASVFQVQESRFSRMLEESPTAILILDPHLRIAYCQTGADNKLRPVSGKVLCVQCACTVEIHRETEG